MLILSRFSPNLSGRKNAENLFPNEISIKDNENNKDVNENSRNNNQNDQNNHQNNNQNNNQNNHQNNQNNNQNNQNNNQNNNENNNENDNQNNQNNNENDNQNNNENDNQNNQLNDKGQIDDNNINFYKYMYKEPSSGQKLLVSILFGLLFAIIASPIFHELLNNISVYLGGIKLTEGRGLNLPGLILCSILFTIIVRIILW